MFSNSQPAVSFMPGRRAMAAIATALMLSGCNAASRLSQIGEVPPMSPIENPLSAPNYQPVSLPMPPPQQTERLPNSLWRAGSRSFFKDLRATRVGDVLTVIITMNEKGTFTDDTRRQRDSTEADAITNLLGFQSQFQKFLKHDAGPTPGVNLSTATDNRGRGTINRTEVINLRLAALVIQILPNGNLVLSGKQEVRMNFEIRDLQLAGVVRPEDITPENTVNYDQIAEARISYGGRGQLTDVKQPRYGTQLLDILMPF